MSVYRARRKDGSFKSPYWQFDFVLKVNGEHRRFYGSTGEAKEKTAREWEAREKIRLKSEGPLDHMTLAAGCFRYDREIGQHRASAGDLAKAFEHCCRLIGGARKLINLTTEDIATAVRRRSAETHGKNKPRLVTGATVNRQIVEPMRRLMRRAHLVWKVSCDPLAIAWGDLKMKEGKGRIRELSTEEGGAFWNAVRTDYRPLVWFLGNRGFRVRATLGMSKTSVDLTRGAANVWKKGEGMMPMPLSLEQCAVIRAEGKKSPLPKIWTYIVQRGKAKGMRRPVTYPGLRRAINTTLKKAGIADFHIHDLRHDFASKLLRHTRNLALVQKALGHSDIASTIRYAHVLSDEVAEGMQGVGGAQSPEYCRNAKQGRT